MPQELLLNSNNVLVILSNWWWIALPFLLYRPFFFLWRWWRFELWISKQKFIVLEITIPKEILKPVKAMEQVFSAFWGNVYDPADWWEHWIDGKTLLGISFEIVSIDGKPHFFLRCLERSRSAIESSIFAQYPDAEISEVDDYTKYVPQDIPNKNWSMWATDYQLSKEDVYPIKVYSKFFEEKPDAPKEEKRIDPLSTLLEGMGKLGPGEQLWVQIMAGPITDSKNPQEGLPYTAKGRAVADKLSKRPDESKGKSMAQEVAEVLVSGKTAKETEEKKPMDIMPPEMRLTPGERDIVAGVEQKISRLMFNCSIRFVYLAKKEVYQGAVKTIPFGFFQQFATADLNALRPWSNTITKIKKHWFLPLNLIIPRRLYLRKRKLFKRYISRVPPLFPRPGGTFTLNIEELATIFHFPGRDVASAPFISRVKSKKGGPPPGLPVE
tara:strand:- start:1897 stop:3213 length:1317 start_codon:yes stop_codon:yes gene_type:complete